MASLVARKLSFDTLINLSDADLTLRTDGRAPAREDTHDGELVRSFDAGSFDAGSLGSVATDEGSIEEAAAQCPGQWPSLHLGRIVTGCSLAEVRLGKGLLREGQLPLQC